jgi:hypothetical protein
MQGDSVVSVASMKPSVDERITQYLSAGGLFNPELANHDAVRDLLIDARAMLRSLSVDAIPASLTDERDDPSPQRRAGPWPTAIEPKTRKVDLQVEPLHLEDWIRRDPERAQPQVEPVATVTGYKQITPALVIGTKLYAAPVVALPQVELLEIIRTARAYIGILEANEPDAVAKAFLAELYNKMTEAIKPILP